MLADGIFAQEAGPGAGLIDQRHARCGGGVLGGKQAAAPERDAHDLEVIGGHGKLVSPRCVSLVLERVLCDEEVEPLRVVHGNQAGHRGALMPGVAEDNRAALIGRLVGRQEGAAEFDLRANRIEEVGIHAEAATPRLPLS